MGQNFHGLNKLVTHLSNNEQETSEVQFEEYALKTDALVLRADQRPKQNHKDEILPALPEEPYLLEKEFGPMLNQENIQSPIMKCRRNQFIGSLHRENDGAIEFWRIKDNLEEQFLCCHHWSDDKWKSTKVGGGSNNRFQYCTDSSGEILYLRALQGHSGRNLIDSSSQDNVLIPSDFFQYTYHVGCAISLYSIINSGLIPGGQNLSNRQTVFFTSVDPMDRNHEDLDTINLNEPRHAQYMHKAWNKHQNTVYWFDINLTSLPLLHQKVQGKIK